MNSNPFREVASQSNSKKSSFIMGFIKLMVACYFLIFLFEIFKTFEESIYYKIEGITK